MHESLATAAKLKLTTASAHLQTLKDSRMVATRRDGTKIYYRLAGPDVADLYPRLQLVAQEHLSDVTEARSAFLGPDDTEQVDRQELLRRVQVGDVTVIDVRPGVEDSSGHIPGALSVPLSQLAARLAELPADQDIVAYCRGAYCVLSYDEIVQQGQRRHNGYHDDRTYPAVSAGYRIRDHGQCHGRAGRGFADHESPSGEVPPERSEPFPPVDVGAAGIGVAGGETRGGGRVAVGDDRRDGQSDEQAGAGGGEGREHPRPRTSTQAR